MQLKTELYIEYSILKSIFFILYIIKISNLVLILKYKPKIRP